MNKNKNINNSFTIIANNSNGIIRKQDRLFSCIRQFNASVCFLQETKVARIGQVKIPSFQIFEVVRKNQEGGSILTAVHEKFNPIFISGGENDLEITQTECRAQPQTRGIELNFF